MGLFDRIGARLVTNDRLAELEIKESTLTEAVQELDSLGYSLMGYADGQPNELNTKKRIDWARKARVAWLEDPMCAAAVDLMNDFVFGRGVPKPRAKDDAVQEIIDEFWDDPDNQRVLTSYEAQMTLGTDMTLQSNVFVLLFDQGDDGKVKLGLLNHDEVVNAVTDPDFRQRVLYYLAKHKKVEWDFDNDRPKIDLTGATLTQKPTYYQAWQVAAEPEDFESGAGSAQLPKPPANRLGVGKVYHMRMNRTSEMIFGAPTMQRTLRWFNAYNEFMGSRVDVAKAVASFLMKRKIKGTPTQLSRIAAKAISRASDLAGATGTTDGSLSPQLPPRTGSILNENENVVHEAFRIPSSAGEASQDALMIRAQVSAATRWPQHYLGDAGSANLATATAMELPVLKAVESRQELFEQLFRWGIDRAIERAVDTGRLDTTADSSGKSIPIDKEVETPGMALTRVEEAHDGQGADEQSTQRDLSYEFSMPSPLRRMMVDLVAACAQTAQVFDPNNTNTELSRVLLTLVLGEGFEMEDPAEIVDRIYPEGYVDPAVAAAQAAAQQPQLQSPDQTVPGEADAQANGGGGAGGYQDRSAGEQSLGGDTSYGAKGGAVTAGTNGQMQEAVRTRGRDGDPVVWREGREGPAVIVEGRRLDDGDERVRAAQVGRGRGLDDDFATLEGKIAGELDLLTTTGS